MGLASIEDAWPTESAVVVPVASPFLRTTRRLDRRSGLQ